MYQPGIQEITQNPLVFTWCSRPMECMSPPSAMEECLRVEHWCLFLFRCVEDEEETTKINEIAWSQRNSQKWSSQTQPYICVWDSDQ